MSEHIADVLAAVSDRLAEAHAANAALQARVARLEAAIDGLFKVDAFDVYSDGTLGIASTALLLDAIVDLMNVRGAGLGGAEAMP